MTSVVDDEDGEERAINDTEARRVIYASLSQVVDV